jgi:hypothetical protein
MSIRNREETRQISRLGRRPAFLAAGGFLALLVYLAIAWFVLPPDVFCTPDEGAKLLQVESLRLVEGELAYDLVYHGRDLDPDLQFAPDDVSRGLPQVQEGKLYVRRIPLFPLLVVPFFRWFGFRGLYLIPALAGCASGTLALCLLEQRDRRPSMWLLIAFGSPVLIYSTLFWEHTLATSLGLAAAWFALHLSCRRDMTAVHRSTGWFVVGVTLGASIYIRLEMAIFALTLLFAIWLTVRRFQWSLVWAAVPLVLLAAVYLSVHYLLFDQPLPDNAYHLFYPLRYLRTAEWNAVTDLLIGPPVDGAPRTGWLGGLWAIAAVVAAIHGFRADDSDVLGKLRIGGMAVTAIVAAIFLYSSTPYYSAHGLLFTTPWALIGVCRAGEVWRHGDQRAKTVTLTAMLGLTVYAIAIVGLRGASPHGGTEWGARFAMPFYPLLALIAGWDLRVKQQDARTMAAIGALFFLGLAFQVRGIGVIRHSKQINAEWNQILMETPEQHVVFSQWWMPLNAAPVYAQKQAFVVSTPEELGNWTRLAAENQVSHFYLVTTDDTLLENAAAALDGHRVEVIETQAVDRLLIHRVHVTRRP